MADLNALIAQGAQFQAPVDPFAQYAKMQQLNTGANQNALAQYQLEQSKRADVQANALNRSYQENMNPETGEINYAGVYKTLAGAGAGSSIPNVQQQQFKVQQEKATLAKTQGEIDKGSFELRLSKANKAISDIAALNSPEEAIASIDNHVAKGDIDQEKAALIKSQLAQAPSFVDWQKSVLTNILDAKDRLTTTAPKPVETRLGNVVKTVDMNPLSATYKQEVIPPQAIGMSANESAMLPIHKAQLAVSQGQLSVAQQRLQAEMATGILTPQTVDFMAETYRQTGTLPPMGMGPMAAAARSRILERAAQLSMGDGQTAAQAATDVRTSKAENAGMTSGQRAIGTQIANVQVAANETKKMIDIARTYVDKVNPTDYPVLNAAGNFIAKNTGDPAVVGLATSLNAAVNTYARAINPKGVATVSDKNHAREILTLAMAKGQLNEAFNVMTQEMGAALTSGPETKAGMRAANAAPAAPAAATTVAPNINDLLNKYK